MRMLNKKTFSAIVLVLVIIFGYVSILSPSINTPVAFGASRGSEFNAATTQSNFRDEKSSLQLPLEKLSENIRHLLESIEEEQTIRVVIRLQPADIRGVEKRQVIDKLKSHADRVQGQLMEILSKKRVKVLNKFWLANSILAEVEAGVIRDFIHLPEVVKIHEDFEIRVPEPLEDSILSENSENGITWGLRRIGGENVWSLGIDGSGIRVAVIDTGVDITHPDLAGKMWTDNENDSTYPGGWIRFDRSGNIVVGSEPSDTHGHGTHCSGTVLGDNASGTAIGVAPGAWLMHACALPGGGGTFAQTLAAMQWAIAPTDQYGNPAGEQADVVSMSWGSYGYWEEKIEPIRDMIAAGVVPVASIGNEGLGLTGSPGNVYEAFGIGAIDVSDAVWPSSSGEVVDWPVFHPEPYIKPDFSAPGVDVYSSVPENNWEYWRGTSMAAPHVAGTIALMLDANDNLTVDDIYYVLRETSDDLGTPGKDNRYGWGVINAFDATVMVQLNSGIQGYVVDNQTSEGLAEAKVFVQENGWTRYADENGYYRIFSPPDNYTLTASAFGYDDNDNIAASVDENQWTILDIELAPLPTGFLSGKVTDNAFNPIENATITLLGTPLSTITDENGAYILEAPIGSYNIKASAWGFESAFADNIEVVENSTTQKNFELNPTKKVPPIYINGNSDFIPSKGVTAGSGTADDPFIIDGWEIDMPKVNGIKIRNTDAYFVIENVYVHGGWVGDIAGIRLENVKNGRIENSLLENKFWGIGLMDSSNNTISNNVLQNIYGLILARSDNNAISNNIIENGHLGIYLDDSSNITLSNNKLKNNYHGIWLVHSDNGIIFANFVAGKKLWYGVFIFRSSNSAVLNNAIEYNSYGILVDGSDNNTISNNELQKNIKGIVLAYSNNNITSNNIVENIPEGVWTSDYFTGIYLAHSSGNALWNNTVKYKELGIRLFYVEKTTIFNNIVENCSEKGIYLANSPNNIISNNDVSHNQLGIDFSVSNSNLIYHNNVTNNVVQAYDNGSNQWDFGYPSGGNYWSDYTGVDENQGENQDIPGSDGIGDTPYLVPPDTNQDRYPLMSPIVENREVAIQVSPGYKGGLPGATLDYTVTLTNTGNVIDIYSLTATDNASWDLSSSRTWLVVSPGENKIAMLSVTIPSGAEGGTEDSITVTATSMENTEVSDSASCTAQATLWRVEVSISPESKSGPPGETLTYEVTVTNKGNIEDTYDLGASDNAGWNPTVSDNLLENIQPGENRIATLTVTIPDDASSGAEDNVTVTATSMENTEVSDSASCTAQATALWRVEVSISPESKRGPPKGKLEYTATVVNKGNVEDNYDLEVKDSENWGPSISPTSLTIPPNDNRTATLSVIIPEDAEGGTKDTITVTATSRTDNKVRDSASCIVHVTHVTDFSTLPADLYWSDTDEDHLSFFYFLIYAVKDKIIEEADLRVYVHYVCPASFTGKIKWIKGDQDYEPRSSSEYFTRDRGSVTISFSKFGGTGWQNVSIKSIVKDYFVNNWQNHWGLSVELIPDTFGTIYSGSYSGSLLYHGYVQPSEYRSADWGEGEYAARLRIMYWSPTLLSPTNGSTITDDNTPTLTWSNENTVYNNELWVDNDSNFSSPVVCENIFDYVWTTPSSIHSMCGQEIGHENTKAIDSDTGTYWQHATTEYHWIVFDMGETRTITKIKLYQSFMEPDPWGGQDGVTVYVSDDPANWGDNVWEGDMFGSDEWVESGDFNKDGRYVKLVSKQYDYSEYSGMCEFQACCTVPATSYTTGELENDAYYWKVLARKNASPAKTEYAWSSTWSFTIGPPPPVSPTKPQLYLPRNKMLIADNTPYLEWKKGENADNHRLLIDNDSDFSSPNENLVFTTENGYTITIALAYDNYFWKVVAANENGENSSDVWTFEVNPSKITPSDDSFTWSGSADSNYGGHTYLSAGGAYRGHVKFYGLPDNVTITSTKLYLYHYFGYESGGENHDFQVHRVTMDWNESTITWNNQPNYENTATDTISFMCDNYEYWRVWDVTVDLDSGALDNDWVSWTIIGLTSDTSYAIFRSKEYDNLDPYLEIEYGAPAA